MKAFPLFVLASLALVLLAPAKEPEPNKLDAAVMVFLEAHEPLHLDQLHQLLELTYDDKITVETTCESLQRLVVAGKVEISTTPNNEKWRPLTVILWDDVEHKKNEQGTDRR